VGTDEGGLLADVLPITSGANGKTLRQHSLRVAERADAELDEERGSFIDGCPAQWQQLPVPDGRIVLGLDACPRLLPRGSRVSQ
jgi:hypothetical protein